jgi:threonine/homoserine/homoserine lactone efflux protein
MNAQLIAFTGVVRNALVSRRADVTCAAGVAGRLLVRTAPVVGEVAAVLVAVPVLLRALRCWAAPTSCAGEPRLREPAVRMTVDGGSTARPLRQGLVTDALNPQAPLTFLRLLPQFAPVGSPALPRRLLWSAIVVALAWLVDRLGRWLRRPSAARSGPSRSAPEAC